MITEDYAGALKKLVVLTQTKNLVLANVTGYDISYISKWCNGIKLPATKHIEIINEKMAHHFATVIQKEHKETALYIAISRQPGSESICFDINQYLSAAYRTSMKKNVNKQAAFNSNAKIMTGYHDILKFMHQLFEKHLQEMTGEGNLLILGEFCTLSDIGIWELFDSVQLNASRLTVRVGLDLDKLGSNPKYIAQLYRLLNKLLDYDFIFYDIKNMEHANLIILKDHFAMQYSLGSDEFIDLCTYIPDAVLIQEIYDRFRLCFINQEPIIAPTKALGINETGFRTAFYSASHFFFFLTNGFDFLLPHDTIESIIKNNINSVNAVHQIRHLRIMWEELLSTGNVEFMLPMASIIRYIETGYMFFTDIEYKTTPKERKAHIQNILNVMQKNPLIIMGILQASTDTVEYHSSNLSYYSNYSSAFLKKNWQYITNNASPIYVVTCKKLTDIFQSFFKSLKRPGIYHRYTIDEINKKYELYKTFINRTLDYQDSDTH